MPMSTKERASIAGRASQARLTPEQRREQMRKVRRDAAAKLIVADWPEFTPEQRATIRAVTGGAA